MNWDYTDWNAPMTSPPMGNLVVSDIITENVSADYYVLLVRVWGNIIGLSTLSSPYKAQRFFS